MEFRKKFENLAALQAAEKVAGAKIKQYQTHTDGFYCLYEIEEEKIAKLIDYAEKQGWI